MSSDSTGIRQQTDISGTLNRSLDLSLAAGTIAAALAGIYLTAMGQKLLQRIDILVVNVFYALSAETALSLARHTCKAAFFPFVILAPA